MHPLPALHAGQGSKVGDSICFQSFDDDYADFETKIQDLDRRLATIFCQGFDDCNSIESSAKVGGGGECALTEDSSHQLRDAENGCSVAQLCPILCDPHGLQRSCPSPTPRAYSNSCPLSR